MEDRRGKEWGGKEEGEKGRRKERKALRKNIWFICLRLSSRVSVINKAEIQTIWDQQIERTERRFFWGNKQKDHLEGSYRCPGLRCA